MGGWLPAPGPLGPWGPVGWYSSPQDREPLACRNRRPLIAHCWDSSAHCTSLPPTPPHCHRIARCPGELGVIYPDLPRDFHDSSGKQGQAAQSPQPSCDQAPGLGLHSSRDSPRASGDPQGRPCPWLLSKVEPVVTPPRKAPCPSFLLGKRSSRLLPVSWCRGQAGAPLPAACWPPARPPPWGPAQGPSRFLPRGSRTGHEEQSWSGNSSPQGARPPGGTWRGSGGSCFTRCHYRGSSSFLGTGNATYFLVTGMQLQHLDTKAGEGRQEKVGAPVCCTAVSLPPLPPPQLVHLCFVRQLGVTPGSLPAPPHVSCPRWG